MIPKERTAVHLKEQYATHLRVGVAVAGLMVCLALAACGGSSSTKTTTSAASTNRAGGSSRFTALRSCLAKQGITLPAPSGNTPPAGTGANSKGGPRDGGEAGGVFKAPSGVSETEYKEALKKCGARNFSRGNRPTANTAMAKAALAKYVACMRKNGVTLPEPATSGNGPIFKTSKQETASASFKAAEGKCQSDLKGVIGVGGGGPPAGGKLPAEGGGPPGELGTAD